LDEHILPKSNRLPKLCFCGHNLNHKRYRSPIRGSKDADFRLVFVKTYSKKMSSWYWGPVALAKNA